MIIIIITRHRRACMLVHEQSNMRGIVLNRWCGCVKQLLYRLYFIVCCIDYSCDEKRKRKNFNPEWLVSLACGRGWYDCDMYKTTSEQVCNTRITASKVASAVHRKTRRTLGTIITFSTRSKKKKTILKIQLQPRRIVILAHFDFVDRKSTSRVHRSSSATVRTYKM